MGAPRDAQRVSLGISGLQTSLSVSLGVCKPQIFPLPLTRSPSHVPPPLQDVLISHIKWGAKELGGGLAVEDVDWATSDQPMLLTSDGVVRVYDLSLQICQSDFTLASFNSQCIQSQPPPPESTLSLSLVPGAVFCPHSISPAASLRLKSTLIHQPWNVDYSLSPADHE